MESTVESAITNKEEKGSFDVWKSFTGGLLEAGIAKYMMNGIRHKQLN